MNTTPHFVVSGHNLVNKEQWLALIKEQGCRCFILMSNGDNDEMYFLRAMFTCLNVWVKSFFFSSFLFWISWNLWWQRSTHFLEFHLKILHKFISLFRELNSVTVFWLVFVKCMNTGWVYGRESISPILLQSCCVSDLFTFKKHESKCLRSKFYIW